MQPLLPDGSVYSITTYNKGYGAKAMEQKFLCDEMLAGLGKWLRVAGYDTLIATPGTDDRELLECAMNQKRTLLTRDRNFLQRRDAEGVVFLLHGNGMESWVVQLNRELQINWLLAPFSRCLLCNGELIHGPGEFKEQMPAYVLKENVPCFHCPDCGKPFWEDGHVERMRSKLKQWSTIAAIQ
ncbi:MAG: DUF5615 family PIN-like protein [Mariprofundaceae bacterium]